MKKLRTWIIVAAMIASTAGAAAGTVLSGYVEGEVKVAVSQPLQVEAPSFDGIPGDRARFSAVSDEGTEFSAGVQLYQGESVIIEVPIVNLADVDHVVEILLTAPILTIPPGGTPSDYSINLDVDGSGDIDDVVQVGPYKWKCTMDAVCNGTGSTPPDPFDGIKITLALGDMVPPGFYGISGFMQVVPY